MNMLINPSQLYTKAICEGGGIINNGEKVYRSFYTKYDKSFVQQIIAKDGSYETKIYKNDQPTKLITKSVNGQSSTIETWDIQNKTGKIRETVSINPVVFLQRLFTKDGLSNIENKAQVTRHMNGKKARQYFDTAEFSKQVDVFDFKRGNPKISDEFNAFFKN